MNALISVIVPVYNAAEYLERCVLSICNQSYKDLEIILVDDGSNDGSEKLCDRLQEKDDRIIVIHQKNGGSTSARNAGLRVANGKYIGFVDSDDWIETDMYETLVRSLNDDDSEISVIRQYLDYGSTCHREGKRSIEEGIIEKESGEMPHHIIYSDDYRCRGISPNLYDKLFLKDLVVRHQKKVSPDTKYAEDDLCVYASLLDANRVSFINRPMYHYCRHASSVTHTADDAYFEKINFFYKQMKNEFTKHAQSCLLMRKLDMYMLELVMRGVNWQFGLPFGRALPFFIPPYAELYRVKAERIALYGAGDVGKDYYRSLKLHGEWNVTLWVDANWKIYKESGLDVKDPDSLRDASLYDAILIAIDSEYLLGEIRDMLTDEFMIDPGIIIHHPPVRYIETVDLSQTR